MRCGGHDQAGPTTARKKYKFKYARAGLSFRASSRPSKASPWPTSPSTAAIISASPSKHARTFDAASGNPTWGFVGCLFGCFFFPNVWKGCCAYGQICGGFEEAWLFYLYL